MRAHRYERAYLIVGAGVLLACAAALVYASTMRGMHLPTAAGQLDPLRAYQTAPFNHPGVRQTGPGTYEVVLIAQAWAFMPNEIRLPANVDVTFIATSADIIHGFEVAGTRLNMMLIPGQISRATHRFKEPGEHLLICHEYCGLGHHTMFGKVIVE